MNKRNLRVSLRNHRCICGRTPEKYNGEWQCESVIVKVGKWKFESERVKVKVWELQWWVTIILKKRSQYLTMMVTWEIQWWQDILCWVSWISFYSIFLIWYIQVIQSFWTRDQNIWRCLQYDAIENYGRKYF